MTLARDIVAMRRAPLFRVLDPEQLRRLASGSEHRHLRRDQVLHEPETPADAAALVLFGQLELRRADDRPTGQVAAIGALLDGPALLIETVHAFRAVARVQTELLLVPRGEMLHLLRDHPEVAARLQSEMTSRTAALVRDLDAFHERFRALGDRR